MNCLTAPALFSSGARPPSVSLHSKGALCGEGLPPRQIRRRWGKKKKKKLLNPCKLITISTTLYSTWVLGVSAAVIQGGSIMPGAVSVTILTEKGEFSHWVMDAVFQQPLELYFAFAFHFQVEHKQHRDS